ncbi:potassium ion transporter [Aspergillus fischeri NRRL 181]|uniref:Cation transporter, putative n=1 Tax=Neosartorya fischeri (strain ATCC 1020 / DSM 3700 / CBS 544.65 / FGSC A1164 / JCM 1740 / NRRL 181 / WB 181) TaxID=331117 RepID=A1DIV5_NEOFI|nr:cation transporter, putative [Aspergillus fischeri NRRL 181]EAW19312.1 cation transporter, putative [Aspergillus fischeri NRRL 181]
MWKPSLNFITLHYAYIITLSILSLAIIYPYGNLRAIDAFFFGASASTESGLNTVDVNRLKTYQQVYIYVTPIISNLGFVNIIVVIVRLRWFEKRLKEVGVYPYLCLSAIELICDTAPAFLRQRRKDDAEARVDSTSKTATASGAPTTEKNDSFQNETQSPPLRHPASRFPFPSITFAEHVHDAGRDRALYVPPPWQRDRGQSIVEVDDALSDCERTKSADAQIHPGTSRRRFKLARTNTLERVASTMFVLGPSASHPPRAQTQPLEGSLSQQLDLPELSSHATLGRNSQFRNLTDEDREMLGGIEYRSLKLLLKIVTGYFFGLHLFGAICLVGWIQHANPKYREYLAECGQGNIWWAFYSAQTMVDNLGFTLTPDSMISFQDATFPLLVMSFLAYAGNTFYPCLLRFIIWTMSKLCPRHSSLKEPLAFLLTHPRRCYTLLFPSKPTWVLFAILFTMNLVDVILIIVLDLHNPTLTVLPPGPRVLAAIFQAASARHTGTAVFNLANVNPAVQFSLLVMMYIAIYPIAISVRASNTYEERALGIYPNDAATIDESDGRSYVLSHIRNQLTFDLWYIFLGIFCICIAESDRVMDPAEPAFAVFPIFFEVVSAYANVGLSLGYPTVNTSLSGQFSVFSKLVICAMMIRGRHRGLPYQLDRAIVLPNERLDDSLERVDDVRSLGRMGRIKRFHTS